MLVEGLSSRRRTPGGPRSPQSARAHRASVAVERPLLSIRPPTTWLRATAASRRLGAGSTFQARVRRVEKLSTGKHQRAPLTPGVPHRPTECAAFARRGVRRQLGRATGRPLLVTAPVSRREPKREKPRCRAHSEGGSEHEPCCHHDVYVCQTLGDFIRRSHSLAGKAVTTMS